jgi:hypothetical protein
MIKNNRYHCKICNKKSLYTKNYTIETKYTKQKSNPIKICILCYTQQITIKQCP